MTVEEMNAQGDDTSGDPSTYDYRYMHGQAQLDRMAQTTMVSVQVPPVVPEDSTTPPDIFEVHYQDLIVEAGEYVADLTPEARAEILF